MEELLTRLADMDRSRRGLFEREPQLGVERVDAKIRQTQLRTRLERLAKLFRLY